MDPSHRRRRSISENTDGDPPWIQHAAVTGSDNRGDISTSKSYGPNLRSLEEAEMGREVEAEVSRMEEAELQILSRCRRAMALGIGTAEGEQSMRLAIRDLLQQPWAHVLQSTGTAAEREMVIPHGSGQFVSNIANDTSAGMGRSARDVEFSVSGSVIGASISDSALNQRTDGLWASGMG